MVEIGVAHAADDGDIAPVPTRLQVRQVRIQTETVADRRPFGVAAANWVKPGNEPV